MTQETQAARISRLINVLSPERLRVYSWSGAGPIETLERYALNVSTCEAFYTPLQLLEVALRNRVVDVIRDNLPKRYPRVMVTPPAPLVGRAEIGSWLDPSWLNRTWPRGTPPLLAGPAVDDIEKAKRKLFGTDGTRRLKLPASGSPPLSEGQLVAALDFGFWTGLFHSSYVFQSKLDPKLWGGTAVGSTSPADTLNEVFRHRKSLLKHVREIAPLLNELRHFRNLVFHHEPIFATGKRKAPIAVYGDIKEILGWLEPELSRQLDAVSRVNEVLSADGQRAVKAALHASTWR